MPTTLATSNVTVKELRIEHLRSAFGIGAATPRLSWIVHPTADNWRQSAYKIELLGPDGSVQDETGWVQSDESVLVPWPFAPLNARDLAQVRVKLRGVDGQTTAWSDPAAVEVGLLHPGDWTARFVTPDWDEDLTSPQPCPLLRREFDVSPGIARARLYVTAQGVYEAQINGAVVGDHVMAPGWTSYNHRLRYQTFDVT
ncbi:MAG: alpha-L-rhamnosidase N-terminal domain-containing protein, partial [Anaerolineae bacterium]|nr:alpha-L-rhamnosidase N-terminal domain-containing protein [Anaerolineae bacterium]